MGWTLAFLPRFFCTWMRCLCRRAHEVSCNLAPHAVDFPVPRVPATCDMTWRRVFQGIQWLVWQSSVVGQAEWTIWCPSDLQQWLPIGQDQRWENFEFTHLFTGAVVEPLNHWLIGLSPGGTLQSVQEDSMPSLFCVHWCHLHSCVCQAKTFALQFHHHRHNDLKTFTVWLRFHKPRQILGSMPTLRFFAQVDKK